MIGGASALFGIWFKEKRNDRNAIIATCITVAGLLVGIYATWQNSVSAARKAAIEEQRHQTLVSQLETQRDQAREDSLESSSKLTALLSGASLNSLVIRWRFPDVSEQFTNPIYFSQSGADAWMVSDDETKHLPRRVYDQLVETFHIGDAVASILTTVARSQDNPSALFSGDIERVSQTYRDIPDEFDPLEFESFVHYDGPTAPIVLLPVNASADGILAIGRISDDKRPLPGGYEPDDGLDMAIAEAYSYEFDSRVFEDGNDLVIEFRYDSSSLKNGFHTNNGSAPTLVWPDSFNFFVVPEGFPDEGNYYDVFGERFRTDVNVAETQSTLSLIPNGLEAAAIHFDVSGSSWQPFIEDWGDLGDNEVLFEFGEFHAVRTD